MLPENSRPILIIVAMESEAQPIVNILNLQSANNPLDSDLPTKVFAGEKNQTGIYLVTCGLCKQYGVDRIGTQPAALLAWEAIKAFKPRLVMNAGTAGGFVSRNAQIGDVYISKERVKYHDRLLHPVTDYIDYGIGSYHCYDFTELALSVGIKPGIISTGNSLLPSTNESQQMTINQADIKEMEAAAIAEVAWIKQTPFTALKVVTDFVDHSLPPHEQFVANFPHVINKLAQKINLFLDKLLENKHFSE